MPLPLAPVAVIALRCGAVALTTWAAKRALAQAMAPGRRDQRAEDALDALPEGLTRHADAATSRATAASASVRRNGTSTPPYSPASA